MRGAWQRVLCKIKYQLLLNIYVHYMMKINPNLKLIDNLVVSPDTSTMASCADWTAEWGSLWIGATIDCLRAVSDGMLSVECRHTYFNSYLQNLWPPLKFFPHHAFSSLGTPDIPSRNPVWETLVQCNLASCWLLTKYHEILLHVNTMSSGGLSQNNPDGDRTESAQGNFRGLRTSDCRNAIKMSLLQIDVL